MNFGIRVPALAQAGWAWGSQIAQRPARSDRASIEDGIGDAVVVLTILAAQQGLRIEDCIETAWNEIKDRKGRMVNGVFVKEADLG